MLCYNLIPLEVPAYNKRSLPAIAYRGDLLDSLDTLKPLETAPTSQDHVHLQAVTHLIATQKCS